MQVSLVMFKADGTRRDFPVSKDRTVVGRKNNCDLRIPLSSVSRQHCEIRVDEDEVKLRDLGSSNGTYHNGIRVQESTLSAGDEVVIGPVVFIVVIDGEPADVSPTRTVVNDDQDGEEETPSPTMPTMVPETDQPRAIDPLSSHVDEDDDLADIEPDFGSPTVDLDDDDEEDPIAALERLAEAERLNSTSSGVSVDPQTDEDEEERTT